MLASHLLQEYLCQKKNANGSSIDVKVQLTRQNVKGGRERQMEVVVFLYSGKLKRSVMNRKGHFMTYRIAIKFLN